MTVLAACVHGDADRETAHAAVPRRGPDPLPRAVRPLPGSRRPSQVPVLRRCPSGGGGGECQACQSDRPAPPSVYDVLGQQGTPLDRSVLEFLEPRLGQSLTETRIHTDTRAQDSAAAVGAHAYTVGRDIVFGSPGFDAGDRRSLATLAHELTHTVQDGVAGWAGEPLVLDSPHTESERAARAVRRRSCASPVLIRSPPTTARNTRGRPRSPARCLRPRPSRATPTT
jgi:hypothetical protein